MIVSHKYQFVYLAPPKTANRSLHSYLGQPAFVEPGTENRKGTMHVFEVPEEVRHYFTFASIRHPLDRTASLWAHSQTDISRKMQKTVTMGFEEFVLNFQFRKGTLWFFTKSQTELLARVRLDGVVRFDHLEEDLARLPPIARALKTETRINPLPRIGKNDYPPWQDLFSPRMRRMVLRHWGADLDLYARGEEGRMPE